MKQLTSSAEQTALWFGRKYRRTVRKREARAFITKPRALTFRLYVHIFHSDVRFLPSLQTGREGAATVRKEDGWLTVSPVLLGLSEEAAEKTGRRNDSEAARSSKTPISHGRDFLLTQQTYYSRGIGAQRHLHETINFPPFLSVIDNSMMTLAPGFCSLFARCCRACNVFGVYASRNSS